MNSNADANKTDENNSQIDHVEMKATGQNYKSGDQILHEFAGYTTAHGLNRLVESVGIIRKLVWATFCLGALAMFLYQTYGLFKQYLARPVATTLIVEHPTDVKFPAITICNLNMVRMSKIPNEVYDYVKTELPRLRALVGSIDPHPPVGVNDDGSFSQDGNCDDNPSSDRQFCDDPADIEDIDAKLEKGIIYLISNMDYNRTRSIGHQFKRLIYDCTFMGYKCLNFTKYWNMHWNYRYSNCFTFNSGFDNEGRRLFVKQVQKTGPSHGLKLILNIERPEYVEELSQDAGAIITVAPQGNLPFPDEGGVGVMPGRTTYVGLRKELIERVDPFNNGTCHSNTTLDASNIYAGKQNILYSSQVCVKSCQAAKQYQECGCADVQFQSPNVRGCDELNSTEDRCLGLVKKKFRLGELDCESGCPAPCRCRAGSALCVGSLCSAVLLFNLICLT